MKLIAGRALSSSSFEVPSRDEREDVDVKAGGGCCPYLGRLPQMELSDSDCCNVLHAPVIIFRSKWFSDRKSRTSDRRAVTAACCSARMDSTKLITDAMSCWPFEEERGGGRPSGEEGVRMDGKDEDDAEDDEIIALESSRFRFCLSEEAIRPSAVAVVGPDYRINTRKTLVPSSCCSPPRS